MRFVRQQIINSPQFKETIMRFIQNTYDSVPIQIFKTTLGTYLIPKVCDTLLINGKIVSNYVYPINSEEITSLKSVHKTSVLTHYMDGEGNGMSIDEFVATEADLRSRALPPDPNDDHQYQDVFNYKFQDQDDDVSWYILHRKYSPVYDNVLTMQDIPFEIIDLPNVPSEYEKWITPEWRNSSNLTPYCTLALDNYVWSICENFHDTYQSRIRESKETFKSNRLEYMTVNGQRLMEARDYYRKSFNGTLQECIEKAGEAKSIVMTALFANINMEEHFTSYKEVVGDLSNILSQVNSIEAKQKTAGNKNIAMHTISTLITKYKNAAASLE